MRWWRKYHNAGQKCQKRNVCHNSTCSDTAVKGLKAEIKSLQDIQRPVNSEVEELKKALQATKNVMEYKENEEEHGAYKKVKMRCNQTKR